MKKKYFFFLSSVFILQISIAQIKWPVITQQTKPWTRWWWMGSAVDEKNISALLQQYSNAGFGGTEIVPIYGAKGFENSYIKYLSPQWMKMLDHTVKQSDALNMGVYISVGTGWPIGGADVSIKDAASKLIVQQYQLKADSVLQEKITVNDEKQKGFATLSAVMAFNRKKDCVNLSDKVNADGTLQYTAADDLTLYAIFTGKTKQMVKRAAPGGKGYTIDHFGKDATADYFKIFDTAFGNSSHGVKAFFNDSYEVYNADWTLDFFNEFLKRRGYDLRNYFNLFFSNSMSDTVARLKCDYRETISDLMKENFSTVFTQWTNKRKTLSVNQAHGSPGNLLDLYSAFDIPECETYGSSAFAIKGLRRDSADIRNVDPDPIMLKFASSAAHAYNKPLTSCETFTWLGEHFKTSWSQCKPEVDQAFLSGINHVFYHGTTYSPEGIKWPGWLFYASVQFNPTNSLWPHLKGLNEYIARCQAILQAGVPDNDIIKMYWPVYDVWQSAKGMDMPLMVHDIDKWLLPTAFYKNVVSLQKNGFEVDFLSDKMIKDNADKTTAKKKSPQVIVVPECNYMQISTINDLIKLAQNGDYVILQLWPEDVPGFNNYTERKKELSLLFDKLSFKIIPGSNSISESKFIGNGKLLLCKDVKKAIEYVNLVKRETLADLGLKFIKRRGGDLLYYFIINNTANDIDEKVKLETNAGSVVFMDPLNGNAGTVPFEKGEKNIKVRLQLKSGQSIIIRTNLNQLINTQVWKYTEPSGKEIILTKNKWILSFKDGGPQLPVSKEISPVQPWTNFTNDSTEQSFSGIGIYTTTFTIKNKSADYLLMLDKLYESAKIIINGKEAGLIWSLPFELKVGKYLQPGKNTISIEVCNLMANRIRNMDRNNIVWRNYHEINFVNIDYKNFDASNWKVLPSGLDGEIKIVPLK